MLRFVLALALGFFLALSGCDRSHDRILGKWKAQNDSGLVWEFAANGVVKTGDTAGRYTFGDGRRIKIQTPSATFVYQLEMYDGAMTWTAPNGTRMELRRVP